MRLSIVIPVYNESERELSRCLDSVKRMDIRGGGYEVLVIDNNSKESVGTFLIKYCDSEPEFHYLLETEQGVSSARNRGIAEAIGDYIAFLDADDYMIRETVENYFKNIIQADQIIFNQLGNMGKLVSLPKEADGYKEWSHVAVKKLTGAFPGFYTALYRRSFLIEHGVLFPQGVRIGEDHCFSFSFLGCKPVIYYINRDLNYVDFDASSRKNRYLDDPEGAVEDLLLERKYKSDFLSRLNLVPGKKDEILSLLNNRLVDALFSELLYLKEGGRDISQIEKRIREVCFGIGRNGMNSRKCRLEHGIICHKLYFLLLPICWMRKISQKWRHTA